MGSSHWRRGEAGAPVQQWAIGPGARAAASCMGASRAWRVAPLVIHATRMPVLLCSVRGRHTRSIDDDDDSGSTTVKSLGALLLLGAQHVAPPVPLSVVVRREEEAPPQMICV